MKKTYFLYRNFPVYISIAVLASIVNIKAPNDHIPSVTPISIIVGVYSAILPYGPGIKPGTIKPKPFSIQIATNKIKQAKNRNLKLFLNLWNVRIIVAVTFKVMEVHIQGKRAVFPSNPKNK